MTATLSRWLPGITLGAWSAILLHAYFGGRVLDMLHPMFRPYVLVAGLVMALMAIVSLLAPMDAECCEAGDCGHPLSRTTGGKVVTFLILVLPLLAASLFSKDEFSKQAMVNRGVVTDASSLPGAQKVQKMAPPELPLPTNDPAQTAAAAPSAAAGTTADPAPNDYLQRTPEGLILAEVLDLLYAAQDGALRKDFEGKGVQLIGQLMPDSANNANGRRFKAVRMFMTCCAADARPVATIVEAEKLPDLPEMTWIKITGTSTFPVENGKRLAVLKADHVEKTQPPEETMLY